MKHILVCYISCADISNQKLDRFRPITEKLRVISIYTDVTLHSKKPFWSFKAANKNYLGGSSQFLIFDSKLDTLPKIC